jgi:hypothetical protein
MRLMKMVIVVALLCEALVACSANGVSNSGYPGPATATAFVNSPATATSNPTVIAGSVSPGTPAGSAQPSATIATTSPGGQTSGCDAWKVEQPITLPSPFAPNFPVPGGMKWYKNATIRNDTHTQLQVTGIVPLSLIESAKFLVAELPKAGYEITNTDSEANEADGLYKGNGWIGSYRVSLLDNCITSTMWSIRVLKL